MSYCIGWNLFRQSDQSWAYTWKVILCDIMFSILSYITREGVTRFSIFKTKVDPLYEPETRSTLASHIKALGLDLSATLTSILPRGITCWNAIIFISMTWKLTLSTYASWFRHFMRCCLPWFYPPLQRWSPSSFEEVRLLWIILSHVSFLLLEQDIQVLPGGHSNFLFF